MKIRSAIVSTILSVLVLAPPAAGEEYVLSGDSLKQEGVPTGTVTKHTWDTSEVFAGTTRDYWIYVPAQYDGDEPAAVMVFQDGGGYVVAQGPVRAATVFDNLIHKREMPVTIGIFITPGRKDGVEQSVQRSIEYDTLGDAYARFLLDEILPEVGKDYALIDNAQGRAIGGISSGGICAFTVAWERPDAFSKVVSHVGSFTDIRGGHEYPFLIRKTRGNPKPIRAFLQDGENDLNVPPGDWTLGNLQMESALKFARYDYRFVMGPGGHNLQHGGAIFPDTMRWIWRDYPGVKGADGGAPDFTEVTGQWDVQTNVLGDVNSGVLTLTARDGALAAQLSYAEGRETKVSNVSFTDGILRFEYPAPQGGDVLAAWLKVSGNTLVGALGSGEIDFSMEGRRKSSD